LAEEKAGKSCNLISQTDRKPNFVSKIKTNSDATFSPKEYFTSLFKSDEEIRKEEKESLMKEKEDWQKAVKGSRNYMVVNTRVSEGHILDKFKNIRQDPLEKVGYGLSKKKIKALKLRGIKTNIEAPYSPVNHNQGLEWI
jgi:hypothetical protein